MYKFIVVDDEQLIRKGILKKIEKLNLDLQCIGEADNGEDAIKLIKKEDPHIVITDMKMPLLDGKMLLRKLQQDFPHIRIIVISGYSDFEYLQQAISAQVIDYLLKPFNREEMLKALKKAMHSIEKDLSTQRKIESIEAENEQVSYYADLKYLTELISTHQANYDANFLKSNKTSFIKDCKYFVLASVYIPEKKSEELYSALQNYNNQSRNFLIIPSNEKQNICYLLFGFKEHNKVQAFNYISEVLYEIYEYLKRIDSKDTYICTSSINSDLNDLYNSYLETVSCLEKRDLHSKERIYFYNDNSVDPIDLNWNSIDKLIFFIEAGNAAKVEELLNSFFSELEKFSPFNMISVKFNCQLVFNRITELLQGYYDLYNNYSFSNKYERMMNNTFDLEIIKREFQKILLNITFLFREKNIYSSNEIIENIKKYIQKNYSHEITLEKISELFFINPSYCSYLFKEKTGENYADYINRLRISKAKDLLINTDYRVYKIAKMLGYDNDKYFFRIFKKSTGFTPEGFRENFNKNLN